MRVVVAALCNLFIKNIVNSLFFCVNGLYLLANQFEVIAELLNLTVHLVDKAVALLRACVEETEIVLVGLYFLLELVETTHQA